MYHYPFFVFSEAAEGSDLLANTGSAVFVTEIVKTPPMFPVQRWLSSDFSSVFIEVFVFHPILPSFCRVFLLQLSSDKSYTVLASKLPVFAHTLAPLTQRSPQRCSLLSNLLFAPVCEVANDTIPRVYCARYLTRASGFSLIAFWYKAQREASV